MRMPTDQVARGDLDVAHEHRRRIDARLLSHEVDRAFAIDDDPRGRARARSQRCFHRSSMIGAGLFDGRLAEALA